LSGQDMTHETFASFGQATRGRHVAKPCGSRELIDRARAVATRERRCALAA
jgi:hypothetical protein